MNYPRAKFDLTALNLRSYMSCLLPVLSVLPHPIIPLPADSSFSCDMDGDVDYMICNNITLGASHNTTTSARARWIILGCLLLMLYIVYHYSVFLGFILTVVHIATSLSENNE